MQKVEPKKSKWKTWHKVVLGVVLAFIILMAIAVNSDDKPGAAEVPNTASNGTSAVTNSGSKAFANVGDILHTDYFDVTINKIFIGNEVKTGNEFADLKPEKGNKYMVLSITIKNIDKETRMMFDGEILIDYNGTRYKFENAEIMGAEGFGLVGDINPLVTKNTTLVYKIPAEIKGPAYYHPARSEDNETISLGNLESK